MACLQTGLVKKKLSFDLELSLKQARDLLVVAQPTVARKLVSDFHRNGQKMCRVQEWA